MYKCVDISHHNGKIDFSKVDAELVIMKATQGTMFVDSMLQVNREGFAHVKQGFYHFANGGSPFNEAAHFVKTIGEIRDEILVLDWEIQHNDTVNWCLQFLQEVERLTSKKPLIYLNQATVKKYDWSSVSKRYGLWIARYGLNTGTVPTIYKPETKDWPTYAIWQYTSRGRVNGIKGYVDLNLVNTVEEPSIYWQRHPRYKGQKIGLSQTDMQQYGCYLMCWSYLVGKDPLDINRLFIEKGVYKDIDNIPDFNLADDDMIDSHKACIALGLKWIGTFPDINYMPTQKLTIKEVKMGKGQHFVVRINRNGKREIFDPWLGRDLTINYYPFKSYRVMEKL